MYLEYCLIANATICILSLILYYVLTKRNQTSIKNTYTLVFCTVLAMIGASLIPLIAKYLAKGLSISIWESLVVSFLSLMVLTLAAFYFLFPTLIRQVEKKKEKAEEKKSENIVEKTVENSAKSIDEVDESAEEEKRHIILEEDTQQISVEDIQQNMEEDTRIIVEGQEYNKPVFANIPEYNTDKQSDIMELLDLATEGKVNRNYHGAIAAYESALILNPDDELCYLMILDLCSLYKITGKIESVYKLLDSAQCNMLNTDIKDDILRNITIY